MASTHSITEVTAQIGAPSERWVVDQIRSGRFPARKIGRAWRMTDQDIADALDACRNTLRPEEKVPRHLSGLTAMSRKRILVAGKTESLRDVK
jgi:hypothetical protein